MNICGALGFSQRLVEDSGLKGTASHPRRQ